MIDAVHSCQHAHQGGLALDYYFAAPLLDQLRIANELNRIAQALLGIEKDSLALQGRAVPARLVARARHNSGPCPALFVILPTACKITLQQAQIGTIPEGHFIAGIDGERLPIVLGGQVQLPLLKKCAAQIALCIRMFGIKAQRLLITRNCFGCLPLIFESIAQVVVSIRMVGVST